MPHLCKVTEDDADHAEADHARGERELCGVFGFHVSRSTFGGQPTLDPPVVVNDRGGYRAYDATCMEVLSRTSWAVHGFVTTVDGGMRSTSMVTITETESASTS